MTTNAATPKVGERIIILNGPLTGQPCTLATLPVGRVSDLATVIRLPDGHGFTVSMKDIYQAPRSAAANGASS